MKPIRQQIQGASDAQAIDKHASVKEEFAKAAKNNDEIKAEVKVKRSSTTYVNALKRATKKKIDEENARGK